MEDNKVEVDYASHGIPFSLTGLIIMSICFQPTILSKSSECQCGWLTVNYHEEKTIGLENNSKYCLSLSLK
jgi:hypothetical protein